MMEEKNKGQIRIPVINNQGDKNNQNSFNRVFDSIDKKTSIETMPQLLLPDIAVPISCVQLPLKKEIRSESNSFGSPSGPIMSHSKDPELKNQFIRSDNVAKNQSDEDFGLTLMNRLSGIIEDSSQNQTNPTNLEIVGKLARQASFLRLGPENDHHSLELLPKENNESSNFGILTVFLMKFFKSEPITQNDLNLRHYELSILKSFIARKFNKNIKTKLDNQNRQVLSV
jgi:hypothetical protein